MYVCIFAEARHISREFTERLRLVLVAFARWSRLLSQK